MKFYFDANSTVYLGDCREILRTLSPGSINCVVTSPPFWGLRKYHGEQDLIWGGDEKYEHEWEEYTRPDGGGHPTVELASVGATKADVQRIYGYKASFCSLCGAWKGALGLEPTPEMYIQHLLEVLELIKRVLRKDGVVFWNLDDTRASLPPGNIPLKRWQHGKKAEDVEGSTIRRSTISGILKPKDLCLIPERFAIAAQEAGWYVRSKIIWAPSNPMPESCTDRPTDAYQYIFMLTKSPKYWWDQEAVREISTDLESYTGRRQRSYSRNDYSKSAMIGKIGAGLDKDVGKVYPRRNLRNVWTFPTQGFNLQMCQKCKAIYELSAYRELTTKGKRGMPRTQFYEEGIPRTYIDADEFIIRKCRCGSTEWLSHFAVYPRELVERCILAACPPKVCPKCKKPWARVAAKQPVNVRSHRILQGKARDSVDTGLGKWKPAPAFARTGVQFEWAVETLGWQPTCKCGLPESECEPGIVLDPFLGSGTTCIVAKELGRKSIGIELSEDYCRLSSYRIARTNAPLFPLTEANVSC